MRVGIAVEQTLNCPKYNNQFPRRRRCNMCFLDIIARVPEVGVCSGLWVAKNSALPPDMMMVLLPH